VMVEVEHADFILDLARRALQANRRA
jgi:hypothetical protein